MNTEEKVATNHSVRDTLARRKYPRRSFERGVGFLYRGEYQVINAYEIGEGGAAINLPMEGPKGAIVVLSFQIPHGSFVISIAEVRSCSKSKEGIYRAGCLFQDIKFEHKREIRTFVSARV